MIYLGMLRLKVFIVYILRRFKIIKNVYYPCELESANKEADESIKYFEESYEKSNIT
jgi:poly-beta-hydroxyalkanoate depolymerase